MKEYEVNVKPDITFDEDAESKEGLQPTLSNRSISSRSPVSDGVLVCSLPSASQAGHMRNFCGPVRMMLQDMGYGRCDQTKVQQAL